LTPGGCACEGVSGLAAWGPRAWRVCGGPWDGVG
jgi:hypothetical protein